MNCMKFRKLVGAFADGELCVEKNLDALEHLNMCPVCARRVADVQNLRAALQRINPPQPASPELRQRISAALDRVVLEGSGAPVALQPSSKPQDAPTQSDASGPHPTRSRADGPDRSRPGTPPPRYRWSRGNAMLAMAAAVIFCMGILELWSGSSQAPFPPNTVEAGTVAAARKQHAQCSGQGPNHHDPSLPRDLRGAAKGLSEKLGLHVKAPDLSSLGFDFVGAGACGLSGTPGAHILYKSEKYGSMFSLFTVARIKDLSLQKGTRIGARGCLIEMGNHEAAVVIWHEGRQSYIGCACGNLPESVLEALTKAVQEAD
ncbi:MAG: anti-sigma factor family protein [Phycisphaerae bacterium]